MQKAKEDLSFLTHMHIHVNCYHSQVLTSAELTMELLKLTALHQQSITVKKVYPKISILFVAITTYMHDWGFYKFTDAFSFCYSDISDVGY